VALYRGQGGAEFEIEPPREGSMARESFDAQVASGQLVLVEPAPKAPKPAPKAPKPDLAEKK
jgi:hypothetical protein